MSHPSPSTMSVELRWLVGRPELGLVLLAPAEEGDELLGATVSWVHSSDLLDPTPFLAPGNVLLTTGIQFSAEPSEAETDAYAGRLRERGVAGLGFGNEVTRSGAPVALVRSCRSLGLPLFEVPYRTSFIAVTQALANELAREDGARDAWARRAQHAISLAAMRPDGLTATVSELARQLGSWVGLFDAAGRLTRSAPTADARDPDAVARGVRKLLAARRPGSLTVDCAEDRYVLHTLPAAGRLHGVLAVTSDAAQDRAGRDVVTSVIGLASLALQQNRELDRARSLLRTGLLTLLTLGNTQIADATSRQLWGPLPPEPIRVAALDATPADAEDIADRLELAASARATPLFFAYDGELVVCVAATQIELVGRLVHDHGLHGGLSDASRWADFAAARSQARRALAHAAQGEPRLVEFDEVARSGVLAFLARAGAAEIGHAALAPLRQHDAAHGTQLLATVRCWLEHDCEYERAARHLGVHRHTVRARVDLAAAVLGRDLDTLAVRADLWAAYLATGC